MFPLYTQPFIPQVVRAPNTRVTFQPNFSSNSKFPQFPQWGSTDISNAKFESCGKLLVAPLQTVRFGSRCIPLWVLLSLFCEILKHGIQKTIYSSSENFTALPPSLSWYMWIHSVTIHCCIFNEIDLICRPAEALTMNILTTFYISICTIAVLSHLILNIGIVVPLKTVGFSSSKQHFPAVKIFSSSRFLGLKNSIFRWNFHHSLALLIYVNTFRDNSLLHL